MELDNIKRLLDAYFEGNTSLREEEILFEYFNKKPVAEELLPYKAIFEGIGTARAERCDRQIILRKESTRPHRSWWYSAAAAVVVAFGVGSFYLSQPHYSQEEREALAAFEQSKNAMLLLSKNLNKGAEQLTYVEQFSKTKDKVFE